MGSEPQFLQPPEIREEVFDYLRQQIRLALILSGVNSNPNTPPPLDENYRRTS